MTRYSLPCYDKLQVRQILGEHGLNLQVFNQTFTQEAQQNLRFLQTLYRSFHEQIVRIANNIAYILHLQDLMGLSEQARLNLFNLRNFITQYIDCVLTRRSDLFPTLTRVQFIEIVMSRLTRYRRGSEPRNNDTASGSGPGSGPDSGSGSASKRGRDDSFDQDGNSKRNKS